MGRRVTKLLATVGFFSVTFAACHDASTNPTPVSPEEPFVGAVHALNLETFDGSGEAVHPDVALTPNGWGPTTRQFVVTPYPNGSASKENPSFFFGLETGHWVIPEGASNPVITPDAGYLSDPDQLWNPDAGEIWMYYRQVSFERNRIFLMRTRDGVTWAEPERVLVVPNHRAVSPSIVRRGPGDWLMWTVNAGDDGCSAPETIVELRRSTDGITWSEPQPTDMRTTTLFPWHVDVEWIASRGEFWAVYNAKSLRGCATQELYFATSQDGVTWKTYASPLLRAGKLPELNDIVYRSTFVYEPESDMVTFWYSGARQVQSNYVWGVASQRMSRRGLFWRVDRTPLRRSQSMRGDAPSLIQLTNETAP